MTARQPGMLWPGYLESGEFKELEPEGRYWASDEGQKYLREWERVRTQAQAQNRTANRVIAIGGAGLVMIAVGCLL